MLSSMISVCGAIVMSCDVDVNEEWAVSKESGGRQASKELGAGRKQCQVSQRCRASRRSQRRRGWFPKRAVNVLSKD